MPTDSLRRSTSSLLVDHLRSFASRNAGLLLLIFGFFFYSTATAGSPLYYTPVLRSAHAHVSPLRSMSAAASNADLSDLSVVYVTVPNADLGKQLARGIVERKLAACVNLVPGVESIYMWEGKVSEDSELLLIMKTRTALLADLTEYVKKNHSYQVPEVLAMPTLQHGNSDYLQWVRENTKVV